MFYKRVKVEKLVRDCHRELFYNKNGSIILQLVLNLIFFSSLFFFRSEQLVKANSSYFCFTLGPSFMLWKCQPFAHLIQKPAFSSSVSNYFHFVKDYRPGAPAVVFLRAWGKHCRQGHSIAGDAIFFLLYLNTSADHVFTCRVRSSPRFVWKV